MCEALVIYCLWKKGKTRNRFGDVEHGRGVRFNVSGSSLQHGHNCVERNLEMNRMETGEQKAVKI